MGDHWASSQEARPRSEKITKAARGLMALSPFRTHGPLASRKGKTGLSRNQLHLQVCTNRQHLPVLLQSNATPRLFKLHPVSNSTEAVHTAPDEATPYFTCPPTPL